MMHEYHKIDGLFKRDEATKRLIVKVKVRDFEELERLGGKEE